MFLQGEESHAIIKAREEEKCQEKVRHQREKYFQIQYTVA